jgi:hypothetical protein
MVEERFFALRNAGANKMLKSIKTIKLTDVVYTGHLEEKWPAKKRSSLCR